MYEKHTPPLQVLHETNCIFDLRKKHQPILNNSWSSVGAMWSTWFFEIDIWRYNFEKMKDWRCRNWMDTEIRRWFLTWNFTKFLDFCWDMINVHFLMHSSIFSPFFCWPRKKKSSFLHKPYVLGIFKEMFKNLGTDTNTGTLVSTQGAACNHYQTWNVLPPTSSDEKI